MKRFIVKITLMTMIMFSIGITLPVGAVSPPNWNVTGNYIVALNYSSVDYLHDLSLVQDNLGNLAGNGGSPAGANVYSWVITSGTISGDLIDFYADYTATADAVTPQTVMHVTGTIAPAGTMSGTWSDNYQGGSRAGTWSTTVGTATAPSSVLSSPTLGIYPANLNVPLWGYPANTIFQANVNFDGGVTLSDFKSVIISLYSDDILLATNIAKPALFISYPDAPGVTDLFGRGDVADDIADPNWFIGAYSPNINPNKVKFTLTANNDSIYVADGTLDADSEATLNAGTLSAEDFGVVNFDVGGGLGMLKGYATGFGLTDATFASSTSVVVQLFAAGDQLLQTNTAILSKFNADITGTQFSSPFDVSGTFDYAADGYWTNVREVQYGQSIPATKVVATVTLANGMVVTAENTNLTGDPTTIFPITPPVTTPINKDECKNDGWKNFTDPSFRNQGLCVSYVNGRK